MGFSSSVVKPGRRSPDLVAVIGLVVRSSLPLDCATNMTVCIVHGGHPLGVDRRRSLPAAAASSISS
jgi:hypothetical protein